MKNRKLLSSCETDYCSDRHSWAEIERQIRNLAEVGFTHSQWMQNWNDEYLYSPSELLQARDVLRHYGIKAHSIHASEGGRRIYTENGRTVFVNRYRVTDIRKDYTSRNEYCRLAGVDLLKNRVDLCAAIGAGVMVLHMQLPYQLFIEQPTEKEAYYRQVMKSFDELRDYAKCAGVRVALENMLCTPQDFQQEQFDRLFDRYDDDFLAFCWDSGHATIMCREDPYFFLKRYYKRLYATHLQDNESIADDLLYQPDPEASDLAVLAHDRHWVPNVDGSLGRGIVNWDLVARYVAMAPLDLPADFEICLGPDDDELETLRICRVQAEKFYEKVLACKEQPAI